MRARFTLAFVLASAAALVLVARAQSPEPQTLTDCLKTARDYVATTYKAERSAGRAPDLAAINQQKTELARKLAARFPLDAVSGADLLTLARLDAEAGDPEAAAKALAKRLGATGLPDADRAAALAAGVELSMASPVTDAGIQRAEAFAADLDKIPTAVSQRLDAHNRLGGYFRAVDTDEKILSHMTLVLALAAQITPAERKALGFRLMNAYTSIAEVRAGRGENDEALAGLARGLKDLGEVPEVQKYLPPVIERYKLVGKPGAAIDAPTWLNMPAGTTRIDPPGQVTILQFTAHWCGPCRKSYPAMLKLNERFAPRGLRVVFSTQLYGFYEKQQKLSAEAEIEADKQYFVDHYKVPFAISIEPQKPRPTGPGDVPAAGRAFVEDKYFVSGIPQIVVLDKKGTVRRILVGWDPAAEAGLVQLVEKLLGE
jgi:thiol-disulfide isomerase/thioredoxin